MDLANDTIRKNQQERDARRFGGAMNRWIWRFCLVLFVGATVGAVVQSLIGQTHILAGASWNRQVLTSLLVYVASLAVLTIETAGFYAGNRLWVLQFWRHIRFMVGFVGIVWLGGAALWGALVSWDITLAVFGPSKMIDAVIVMVFAAMYGVFNWTGFSFKNTWHTKLIVHDQK